LPMPISTNQPIMALAVNSSDILDSLDQQLLKVTGLSSASYTLKIDGSAVGNFSKDDLAKGVNIALLSTPMQKQAAEVHKLTIEHNDIHFARWRTVEVPLAGIKNSKAARPIKDLVEILDQEEADAIKQQREMAQPKAHRFELVAKD